MLPPDPTSIVGIGDDAAVLPAPDGRMVASTDLLIEGRHFRRDWSSARDIGVKAAAQNLADVAAMGAAPTALLFGLAVPASTAVSWVLELTRGLLAECERGGAVIAGGDVTGADAVMLGITALGTLAGRGPVTRGGARPGDVLALCGAVGRSAAGLAALAAGLEADSPADVAELVAAHRRPRPDYRAGPAAAAGGATAMIDVSDGLVADLGHVARASGVRIDVRSDSLATDSLRSVARRLGVDWRDWALAGGEDHALAASFPSDASLPPGWTLVGSVQDGNGVVVDARPWHGRGGWDHFPNG
jgi:thiamine-monophosphate kinase